jgi:formylglycine-generating enzyme required for sulfatase activity
MRSIAVGSAVGLVLFKVLALAISAGQSPTSRAASAPCGVVCSLDGGSFAICARKVTVGEYREFLEYIAATGDHSACHPEEPHRKDHTPDGWETTRMFEHSAVTGVDWYDAKAYVGWRGMTLPNRQQWASALRASGLAKNRWPSEGGGLCRALRHAGLPEPEGRLAWLGAGNSMAIRGLIGDILEWGEPCGEQPTEVAPVLGERASWATAASWQDDARRTRTHRDSRLGFRGLLHSRRTARANRVGATGMHVIGCPARNTD